jgi:hypothetical protein
MRRWLLGITLIGLLASGLAAQQQRSDTDETELSPAQGHATGGAEPAEAAIRTVTLTEGTKIPLVLRQAISTKSAKVGDAVYAQTNFPVTINDHMAVPSGTYVQGVISSIKRPGRVKGRAEILFHFTTMIFPSGYTVTLPGAVENVPGSEKARVKDKEGTIEQQGEKGKDVGQIATKAGAGAAIGGLASDSVKGAGIGAGVGGATGLAIAMLTRGSDIKLGMGTPVEMVLERELTLNLDKVGPGRVQPMGFSRPRRYPEN